MKLKHYLAKHKFATFSVITFLFSWACWLPVIGDIRSNIFESSLVTLVLFFAGAYAPSLCAILLSGFFEGKVGIKELFKRRLSRSAALKWGILVMCVGPLIYIASSVLFTLFGGELGVANWGLVQWIPVIVVVSILFGPLAEEIGWRGYALPQLPLRSKFVESNLLLGCVWALWHAPLFWAATGTAISGSPVTIWTVGLFSLAVIGSTFIYSWVFQLTNGSILIAILLHLSLNSSGTILSWFYPEVSSAQKPILYGAYVTIILTFVAVCFIGFKLRSVQMNLEK